MIPSRWGWLVVLIGVAGSMAGCGRSGLVPVKGTVKLDGQPLARATVLFIAQNPEGKNATGFTAADGKFRLSTLEGDQGALPGKYKVVVQLPLAPVKDARPAATPEEAQASAVAHPSEPRLPARYSQADQTVLEQEIPPQGEIVFDLQSK